MYESFYGFREKPFNLTPDPEYFYMSQTHDKVYTHLEYAIRENKGFAVITGEIGSGKTTLINFLLGKNQQDFRVGVINNTSVPPAQFIKIICDEFELKVRGMDKAHMMDIFSRFLLKEFSEMKRVVLIIDEAQNLSPKTLEEIRMLSNLEAEKHHLIQIVLVGQPELAIKLQKKGLKQFAQRVAVNCHLRGLDQDEVDLYIRHRLNVAGAEKKEIFNKEATEAIYEYSGGIPRTINILCDAALVYGYADDKVSIDRHMIEEVLQTKELGGIVSISPSSKRRKPEPMEKRLQSFDERIHLLEKTVSSLEQKLDVWTAKDGHLNDIILELFKMLKQNMENRMDIISKFEQRTNQGRVNDVRSPHFSFLKKKR